MPAAGPPHFFPYLNQPLPLAMLLMTIRFFPQRRLQLKQLMTLAYVFAFVTICLSIGFIEPNFFEGKAGEVAKDEPDDITNLRGVSVNPSCECVNPTVKGRRSSLEYPSSLSPTRPHRSDLLLKHWAVITTIFEVNPAVEKFCNDFSDYGLVVVGDQKTDHNVWKNYSEEHSNVVYLSPDDQLTLGFTSALHIPWNHFGRKSLGYLYAMQHGAEVIYDFDDDNHLTVNSFEDSILSFEMALVETKHHLFNPYHHYGAVTDVDDNLAYIWPRGFPLQFIHDQGTKDVEFKRAPDTTKVAIYQSLADHNPDVDAIYRMTSKVPVSFRNNLKQVVLPPQGTFVPWNAQSVLVKESAFFGLLLPTTVTGRVSDIWRSYILTRLLWETDQHIAFTPPIVMQYRNPHSYQQDLEDEADLYYRCDELLTFLAQWKRPFGARTIREAYLNLVSELVQRQFLSRSDEHLVKAWVKDLNVIGYKWPEVIRRHTPFVPRSRPIVDERGSTSATLASTHSPTVDSDSPMARAFSKLEIFVSTFPGKMTPYQENETISGFEELKQTLIPTLQFFWPHDKLKVTAILDESTYSNDHEKDVMSTALKSLFSDKVPVNMKFNPLTNMTLYRSGWHLQQLVMMWADNFTEAEYIGFVDDDTIITSAVKPYDIFDEKGRPRVIAKAAADGVKDWNESSEISHKRKPKVYAMTYFPVVVKREHFAMMRKQIMAKNPEHSSFNDFFVALANRDSHRSDNLSQFGIIMDYLYESHREEYSWHFETSRGIENATAEMYTPFPRIAIHGSYLFHNVQRLREANTLAGRRRVISEIMREGYCHSLPSWNNTEVNDRRCKKYNVDDPDNIHIRGEWKFEQSASYWLTNNKTKAALAHYQRKKQHDISHIWDEDEVENLFGF